MCRSEGISLAMLKGFLISTTVSPQQEHSISKSGDAPKYCLVSGMSRIDLVSKNLLANFFRNFRKKDLKKTAIRKV